MFGMQSVSTPGRVAGQVVNVQQVVSELRIQPLNWKDRYYDHENE